MIIDKILAALSSVVAALLAQLPSLGIVSQVVSGLNSSLDVLHPYLGFAGLVLDFSVVWPMVAAFIAFRFVVLQWRLVVFVYRLIPFVGH